MAARTSARIVQIEVICSDEAEHRRRVESRDTDIPGLIVPSWAAVMARDYEPWSEPRMVIDTARMTAAEAVLAIVEDLEGLSPGPADVCFPP